MDKMIILEAEFMTDEGVLNMCEFIDYVNKAENKNYQSFASCAKDKNVKYYKGSEMEYYTYKDEIEFRRW